LVAVCDLLIPVGRALVPGRLVLIAVGEALVRVGRGLVRVGDGLVGVSGALVSPKRLLLFARTVPTGCRRSVTVRYDAERQDRYGRTLAYVWRARDRRFIQADLVAGGYARTLRVEPNTRHAERLDRLQAKARAARRGLWGACMP